MKKMSIYDPAMCCSTGVCGPSIDPELLRVATIISNLQKKGIRIERHNLSGDPRAFIANENINQLLKKHGPEILPATVLDGQIVKTKEYPTNEEFARLLDIPKEEIIAEKPTANKCNCKPGGCC
ncbi:MAG: Arsenical resistance operon trans-acting repressor ArsD [Firmicutes bacterium ADurb.Bin182]|nr:MAG: Arsenical resistance operon trans-acting repressor ArsD [Firmicutes bacterium ADurb.Bin182]